MSKIINAVWGADTVFSVTDTVFQWDTDDQLRFVDLDLPEYFEVEFANSLTGTSVTALGENNLVTIPAAMFQPGSVIYAWVWITTENGGHTQRQAKIPVSKKARPSVPQPTPEEQSIIDQAILALNAAVDATEGKAEDAEAAADRAELAADTAEAVLGSMEGVIFDEQFSSLAINAVTKRVDGGTRLMNKLSGRRIAAPCGYYYDAGENKIRIYAVLSAIGCARWEFWNLLKKSDGTEAAEELTFETAATKSKISNNGLATYKMRALVGMSGYSALDHRLCVRIFDDEDNEVERFYSAQYRYVIDGSSATRTRFASTPDRPEDLIEFGLYELTSASNEDFTSNFDNAIGRPLIPIANGAQETSWHYVIPDDVFDSASAPLCLSVMTGDHKLYIGPVVEKAEVGGTFWAAYNTTPFADIVAAHNAGKAVFVKESGGIYSLDYVTAHDVTFSQFSIVSSNGQYGPFNGAYGYGIKVTDSEVWTTYDDQLALKSDIGSRADLTTTAKDNLVAAINEVNGKAGVVQNIGSDFYPLVMAAADEAMRNGTGTFATWIEPGSPLNFMNEMVQDALERTKAGKITSYIVELNGNSEAICTVTDVADYETTIIMRMNLPGTTHDKTAGTIETLNTELTFQVERTLDGVARYGFLVATSTKRTATIV